MKKLLTLLGLSVIMSACTTAPGSSTGSVCGSHDDAELSKMTVDELNGLVLKNQEAIKGISSSTDFGRSDRDNCLSQNDRISKIIKIKSKKVPTSRYYTFH